MQNSGKDISYFKTHLLNFSLDHYNFYSMLAGSIIAFVAPLRPFIILLISLILVDLITGLYAARHKNEKIRSRGLYRTVEKLLVQCSVVLVSEGMKTVLLPGFPLTFIIVFVIAAAEFKSIIENTETILGIRIWSYIKNRFTNAEQEFKDSTKNNKDKLL